jgi:WD40 repeat protein
MDTAAVVLVFKRVDINMQRTCMVYLLMFLLPSLVPAGEPAIRKDALGDRLPHFALARLGTMRLKHYGQGMSIAFSPDGKTLATVAGDVCLWDVASGKEIRRISNPGDILKSIDFSGDGDTLIGAGYFTQAYYFMNVQTGKLKHRIGRPPWGREIKTHHDSNDVRPIALTRAGKILGAPITEERVENNPKGGTISYQPQQWIRWYEASTGAKTGDNKLEITWQRPLFVAVTPDEKTFACPGEDMKIVVWDRATSKALHRLAGHKDYALCGAFASDGKTLATGGMDKCVRLWNVVSGRQVRTLKRHEQSVRWLGFCRDGTTLVSASGDRICMWKSASGELIREFRAPRDNITAATLSPNGSQVAALGRDGSIMVWNLDTGREIHPFTRHQGAVNALEFSRDGKLLISGGRDAILLWDFSNRSLIRKLGPRGTHAERLVLLADGNQLLVGSSYHAPELWNLSMGKPIKKFQGPNQSGNLRLSPDGKLLATLALKPHDAKEEVPVGYFWDVEKARCIGAIGTPVKREHNRSDYTLAFSPDGKRVVTGGNNLRYWTIPAGKPAGTVGTASPFSIAFSPDGALLAAEDFDEATIYETATGKEKMRVGRRGQWGIGHEFPLLFSPDGRMLAFGDKEGNIRLWEIATGGERRCFQGHVGYVNALAFAPHVKNLVSAGEDGTILVWDLAEAATKPTSIAKAWAALQEDNAARAYDAICTLAMSPKDTLAFVKKRIPSLQPMSAAAFKKRIVELGAADYKVRAQAMFELEMQQELAFAGLRQELNSTRELETQRRIELLLKKVTPGNIQAGSERLRWLRAIETLEHIGTHDALTLLRALASGSREVRLTQDALRSLRRLPK